MKTTKFYRSLVGGEWIKTQAGNWIKPTFPKITRKLLKLNNIKYKFEKYPHSFTPQANSTCIGIFNANV